MQACLDADLLVYGVNAEVMLGQWEFQIGYRGFDECSDPLTTTDHLWYATWILHQLSEEFNLSVSYESELILWTSELRNNSLDLRITRLMHFSRNSTRN